VKSQLAYIESFAFFAQTFASFAVKKKSYSPLLRFSFVSILLIFLFTITPVNVHGQSEKLSEIIIDIAEELAADDSDPEAVSTYIERLYELSENPVKLNSSGEKEISRLFFLSDFQVKALADYAHSSGRIISVFELVTIPGFDKETAEMMIPFITLDNKVNINSDSVRWRNTSITNLSIKSGNDDTTSLGSPLKILTKYKFTAGGFSGGFTVEKDPGEKFFSADSHLPDFLSANIAYNGSGMIRRLIVGDYSARFGQGTNINTGIRTGLSLTAPGYMSARDEIKPYTSTDENNFFRGVAAEFSIKNLAVSLFYSGNYIDATLGLSSGSSKDYIDNFYVAGIHNTSSLLLKKDVVYELVYGINLSYNFNNVRIGLAWSEDRFSLPVNPTGQAPEDIFDFEGDRNNLYTVYYSSLIKRILLYGEFSTNEYKKYAFVQGLSFRPSDRLTINFLFRNYNAGYTSYRGKGPGSGSATGNEQGILGNFIFEAAKHLFISGGCDIQYFPWLKYRCSAPSSGMRQEIRVRFLATEKLTIDASYNYRLSMVDNTENTGIPEQKKIITNSLKGSVRYSLYDNLTLGTRFDYKVADPSGSRGMLLLQDMNYRFRQLPVTIWFRYCVFNTDTWDSRLYTYENDLLYSFSIPALSGEGSRSYIMAKWEIRDIAEIRLKYSITSLAENSTTFQERDEIKLQLKVWF
jgi:hypothetical protein